MADQDEVPYDPDDEVPFDPKLFEELDRKRRRQLAMERAPPASPEVTFDENRISWIWNNATDGKKYMYDVNMQTWFPDVRPQFHCLLHAHA
jgi:hypothetical protein